MKYGLVQYLLLGCCAAQQITSYTYDVNGRPVAGATRSMDGSGDNVTRAQTVRSLNGRDVPMESIEQKVISERNGVKVIERIIKRYDANGRPGPAEKQTIEERKNPDGTVNTTTTVMKEDLNGRMSLAERSNSQQSKSGDTVATSVTIERPSVNGSLELVERRDATRREAPGLVSESSVSFRKDTNGRFGEAAREVKEIKVDGNRQQENTAIYETSAYNGVMTLLRQVTATSTKNGDKVETEMNVFELETAGKVGAAGQAKPTLKEQRRIEKTATASGTVESVVVRRPLDNDPGRLGTAQKVEETVCTGCKP